jgi:hypothetical protein
MTETELYPDDGWAKIPIPPNIQEHLRNYEVGLRVALFPWMTHECGYSSKHPERAYAETKWIEDYEPDDATPNEFRDEEILRKLKGYWLMRTRGMCQFLKCSETVANTLLTEACEQDIRSTLFLNAGYETVEMWLAESWAEGQLQMFEEWIEKETLVDSSDISDFRCMGAQVLQTPSYLMRSVAIWCSKELPRVAAVRLQRKGKRENRVWCISRPRLAQMTLLVVNLHRTPVEQELGRTLPHIFMDLLVLMTNYLFPTSQMIEIGISKIPLSNE